MVCTVTRVYPATHRVESRQLVRGRTPLSALLSSSSASTCKTAKRESLHLNHRMQSGDMDFADLKHQQIIILQTYSRVVAIDGELDAGYCVAK